MNNSSVGGSVGPEEFQRRMSEFMRMLERSGGLKSSVAEDSTVPRAQEENTSEDVRRFDFKPRDVKDYLDRFVIKQDEAKKVLSVALCDHYHAVRQAVEGKPQANY